MLSPLWYCVYMTMIVCWNVVCEGLVKWCWVSVSTYQDVVSLIKYQYWLISLNIPSQPQTALLCSQLSVLNWKMTQWYSKILKLLHGENIFDSLHSIQTNLAVNWWNGNMWIMSSLFISITILDCIALCLVPVNPINSLSFNNWWQHSVSDSSHSLLIWFTDSSTINSFDTNKENINWLSRLVLAKMGSMIQWILLSEWTNFRAYKTDNIM